MSNKNGGNKSKSTTTPTKATPVVANSETVVTTTVETKVTPSAKTAVKGEKFENGPQKTETKRGKGRPINPNSPNQLKKKAMAEKKAAGYVGHKGRPIVPDSPRQQRIREMEERVKNGEEIHRGRPIDPESERQAKLAKHGNVPLGRPANPDSARQKRLALKGTVKPGRPKKVVEETADEDAA